MLLKDFDEIITSELISQTGGVIAGFLLTFAVGKLYLIPGLFILIPGFLEMRGNISGTLSARLTSGLYVGVMKYRHERKKIIQGNVVASVVLILLVSLFLGVLSYYVSWQMFGIVNTNIIMVAVIAGLLTNLIEIPIAVFATLWFFRHGHDPSNVMGPYVTTTGDITSMLSLLIAIMLVT